MTGNDSLTLEKKTASMKNRDRLKVASGAHGAGILVPYDKKTEVGYREVPETPANLKKMFTKVINDDHYCLVIIHVFLEAYEYC